MKQLSQSGITKTQKAPVSGHQTRRSMIARQENPPAINQPNIEDILALELSDTLINAAYNLTVTKIMLGIHKMCDPVEGVFVRVKLWAFENVRMYGNRKDFAYKSHETRGGFDQGIESRQSILTHIDMLKEESMIKEESSQLVVLTKQLQSEKVQNSIKNSLNKLSKIISLKLTKTIYTAFLSLQTYTPSTSPLKPTQKTSIQQTFQKYQQTRINQRHLHRRSIDKQPQRKSSNQLTYSLNKPYEYQFSRVKSPERNGAGKNLLYAYGGGNTDKKASTCSHTQSNNSQKESEKLSRDYNYIQQGKVHQGSSVLNKLKVTTTNKNSLTPGVTKINDSRVSSLLMNGSYFAEGTKERQLEILRNKYFRLVEEFKDFSERFLQVIKEE